MRDGRRLPAGVRHHHGLRRHLDGPRGHARLARVAARSSPTRSSASCTPSASTASSAWPAATRASPAMLMAAARLDLPSVFVYNGSILPGNHNGTALDITSVFEAVGACAARHDHRGRARRDRAQGLPGRGRLRRHVHGQHDGVDRRGARHVAARLGLAARPSTAAATTTPCAPAQAVVELLRLGITPRQIMTKEAFENAIAVTNAARRLDQRRAAPAGHRQRGRGRARPRRLQPDRRPGAAHRRHEAGRQVPHERPRPRRRRARRDEAPARRRAARTATCSRSPARRWPRTWPRSTRPAPDGVVVHPLDAPIHTEGGIIVLTRLAGARRARS